MAKQTLSFRLPLATIEQARDVTQFYHYKNTGELYACILTKECYDQVNSQRWAGLERIHFVNTLPCACRINPFVYRLIKERCAPGINNTVSIWCALVIDTWLRDVQGELKRQQRGPYSNVGIADYSDRHKTIAKRCLKELLSLPVS